MAKRGIATKKSTAFTARKATTKRNIKTLFNPNAFVRSRSAARTTLLKRRKYGVARTPDATKARRATAKFRKQARTNG